MKTDRILVAAAVVLLTLLTWFQFPGRTYLQADTQIYVPILDRLWDSTSFDRDILARDPHVSFTIYDEVAIGLRRLTGLSFQTILEGQQIIFRALGILGVFLIATALGLRARMALLVAAIFSLGATITGPTVLTIEYEPIPRGFALPILLLAIGLAAHGRDLAAGAAAAVAFLYHAPAVWPFLLVYFCLALWPTKPAVMRRHIWGLMPVLGAVVVLFVLSRLQPGITEPQQFFSRLDPFIEKLQRMRASYVFVSMWPAGWHLHYVLLWAASMLAFWRIRRSAVGDVRFFLIGLPLIGLLTTPLSYLMLERMKSVLIPQVQPARSLLFVVAIGSVLAATAAIKAAEAGRTWETLLWFLLVFAVPSGMRFLELLNLSDALARRRIVVVLAAAACATAAVWLETRKRRLGGPVWAAAALVPFFLFPAEAKVVNYVTVDFPELEAVAAWARTSTPANSVFLFPDAGKRVDAGVFRARASRAIYVDWKGGGQVNFLPAFACEWWDRWQKTMTGRFRPASWPRYASLGIEYLVVNPSNALPGLVPVYSNSKYLVYALR